MHQVNWRYPTTPKPGVIRFDQNHTLGLGQLDIAVTDIKGVRVSWRHEMLHSVVKLKSGSRIVVRHNPEEVRQAISEATDLSRFTFVEKAMTNRSN